MTFTIVIALITAIASLTLGYFARKYIAQSQANSAETQVGKILNEAKAKEQEILLKAREKSIALIDEAKKEQDDQRRELRETQSRLEKRETMFEQKLLEIQDRHTKLTAQAEKVKAAQAEVDVLKEEQVTKLQSIAGLSKEDAIERLVADVQASESEALSARIMKLERESSDYYEKEVKKILSTVVYRYAGSHASETTTTTVQLPNEEMKGRIIGKAGRNIQTIEKLTGCELIIDETPESIMISGFSPIRRQVARLTLEKLMSDGRIHPARIEEVIEEAKKDLAIDVRKAGEDAMYQLGIAGIDPKLISIIGRLKYRTSYGQNQLLHAIEVAYLTGMLASELGLDPVIARKAGLLHDVGKAIDHDTQGSHPELGYQLMKKFGLPEEIAYCSLAHHEDKPKTLLGCLVKAADAISGARPGARRDSYEQYVRRLEELEKVATSFEGVDRAYAIQAGREMRVFVRPADVDDYGAYNIAKEIAKKIESDLHVPGEVKVTVIRESRVIEYAR
ncbi:MAG: ribonuclease Y [Candidatus Magasanikbacteria bacterium]|nr:ribonuclease Y [Candidatus Magasanikbacteria bacterium]